MKKKTGKSNLVTLSIRLSGDEEKFYRRVESIMKKVGSTGSAFVEALITVAYVDSQLRKA